MEGFAIRGEADFVRINLEEVFGFPDNTCSWGGYDVRASIEIKSRGFSVKSVLYTSTGEIYEFFQQLKSCNEKLSGMAKFASYEGNLELTAQYDALGHANIKGAFSEQNQFDNELRIEFTSDQTFIRSSVNELGLIANKYGNMKGISE